ncbi:formylmethanofuran dehydrogenase subunit C [Candidatus Formimonas warabiya]|uniref:Formylmethanofuran dehydrogenase subunit C n=1 Tax=Formimonas warabiya TaxID=1761012 RepID=A0A3G1KNP1_FORW1|nr:formylmethanofuran dehydrogenase subunit C [Candidatus Formimonas warabiya]ATW24046.1 formylmethanofuran dehydrogenase subunit C [Candidatus Formimonas warabiya]
MKRQITLRLKEQPSLPVEAESITPENLSGKSLDQIYRLPLWSGNRETRLTDYFEVDMAELEGEEHPDQESLARIVMRGDLSRFKRLGQGMRAGEMEIHGPVGFHAGAGMEGGSLLIRGNAGDWLGAHMKGGNIIVEGSTGHFTGAAYRGKVQGMTGGTILIKGDVGQMAGSRMRRGLMAVGGDCGDFLGFKMLAGTIILAGRGGSWIGANMRRGTIILFKTMDLLPSFYYNCLYRPVFWGLLRQELERKGFLATNCCPDGFFKRFSGDAQEGGRGEILICQSN